MSNQEETVGLQETTMQLLERIQNNGPEVISQEQARKLRHYITVTRAKSATLKMELRDRERRDRRIAGGLELARLHGENDNLVRQLLWEERRANKLQAELDALQTVPKP